MKPSVHQALLAFGVTALLCSVTATAQTSATANADAVADIVEGIVLQRTADLNFGDISPSVAAGGTVIVSPAGVRTSTGSVTLINNAANPAQAAAYNVLLLSNGGNKKFWIQLPLNGTVAISSGSGTMDVNDFTASRPCAQTGATPPGPGPCAQAPNTLEVGATLLVGANQPVGLYSGTFNVTVHRF